MNLPALHEKALNYLHGFFHDHRNCPVTFFGLAPDENLHVLAATKWYENKEFCVLFLRAYFLTHQITAYAYASEAWVGKRIIAEPGQDFDELIKNRPAPSQDPERREILICGAVDFERNLQRAFAILRPKKNWPRLGGEIMELRGDSNLAGHEAGGPLLSLLVKREEIAPDALEAIKTIIELSQTQTLPSIPVIRILTPAQYEARRN